MGIQNNKGFTLVEIMAVMVILGILAAVAIPRFTTNKKYELNNAVQALVRDIKLAQQEAMGTGYSFDNKEKLVRLEFKPTPPGYQLLFVETNETTTPFNSPRYSKSIELPAGIEYVRQIPEAINLTDSATLLTFNNQGELADKNNAWGEGQTSGFIYLQSDKGDQVSIEVSKPWGKITVHNGLR